MKPGPNCDTPKKSETMLLANLERAKENSATFRLSCLPWQGSYELARQPYNDWKLIWPKLVVCRRSPRLHLLSHRRSYPWPILKLWPPPSPE